MSNKKIYDKLQTLVENEGYESSEDMINASMFSGVVPGICMNDGCDATYNYEPDQNKGWCEECNTNSVQSCLVIIGVI